MGDPVPVRVARSRTVVRYCPSTRIPLPSHAAAAACLATSGPPALRHPPRRGAARLPDTTGTAPRPARHVAATTWFPPRRPARQARSLRASAALLAVGGTPPSARYREVDVLVPLRCVDRLCCCFAARHWVSTRCCHHTPGFFVPATSPVATGDCGAPYHRVITRAPTILLAQPLPRLARRPTLPPVTTAFPHPATGRGRRLRPLPGAGTVVTGLAPQTARPTNTTTARITVSLARVRDQRLGAPRRHASPERAHQRGGRGKFLISCAAQLLHQRRRPRPDTAGEPHQAAAQSLPAPGT